jgi:hypothetical protein
LLCQRLVLEIQEPFQNRAFSISYAKALMAENYKDKPLLPKIFWLHPILFLVIIPQYQDLEF